MASGWVSATSTSVTFHPGKAVSTSLRVAPRGRGPLRRGAKTSSSTAASSAATALSSRRRLGVSSYRSAQTSWCWYA
jgi:hypothetical protein